MNIPLLEEILHTDSPSGNEKEIIEVIKANICSSAKIYTDNLGNCVLYKGVSTKDEYKILIIAHCDEVGFQVVSIEKGGYIKFRPIGGINPTYLPGNCVTIINKKNKVIGCISYLPIHVQSHKNNKDIDYNDLWIDIGVATKEEAEKYVDVGDYITLKNKNYRSVDNDHIFGRGLDNKLGVYVMLEAFNSLARNNLPISLYASATVQEELGSRGCKAVVNKIKPDLVLVIDCGICGDIPAHIESKYGLVELGKGPGINYNPTNNINLNKLIENVAIENSISIQRSVGYLIDKGAENAEIQMLLDGIITTHICIPIRNMHMSYEICNVNDISKTIKLIIKTIESISTIDKKEQVFIPWK